jgi:hypothetical protein
MLITARPLPRNTAALAALAWLVLLSAWTLLSIMWAPIRGNAYHAGQINVLYLGALLAAAALLRNPAARRVVEPGLAAGALIVVGYGLAARFLPGLIHSTESLTAEGRLDQPLSYWNAMGELAAIGLVLSARVAGDATRPLGLRAGAAATAAPLGMGVYLSFSRGALFAGVAGLLVLIVLAPRREQLEAAGLAVLAAVLGAVAAAPFKGVASLSGSRSTRELQGAIVVALLAAIMGLAAAAMLRVLARRPPGEVRLPRHAGLIVLGLACLGLALAIVLGAKESSKLPSGTSAARYTTLSSDRYEYWRVALDDFRAEPLRGVGAGGWQVDWLRLRRNGGFARDAHSLELQTLAELGLVGLALLLLFLGGLVVAARRANARAPALAAGPVAALVVYLAHSPLDWDWQLPALTLVAVVLAGLVLALSDEPLRREHDNPGHARLRARTAVGV